MHIDVEAATQEAQTQLIQAVSAWILHQWHAGLARAGQAGTERPNLDHVSIQLEGRMLAGIASAMVPEGRGVPEPLLALIYISRVLEEQLELHGAEPVIGQSFKPNEVLMYFKKRTRNAA